MNKFQSDQAKIANYSVTMQCNVRSEGTKKSLHSLSSLRCPTLMYECVCTLKYLYTSY